MNWSNFFAAFAAAIPVIGGALLALFRGLKEQNDAAVQRKQAAHEDHAAHAEELAAVRAALEKLAATNAEALAARDKKIASLEKQLAAALLITGKADKV